MFTYIHMHIHYVSCLGVSDKIHIPGVCLYHISDIYSVICMLTSAKVHYHFLSFLLFAITSLAVKRKEISIEILPFINYPAWYLR